MTLPSFQGTLPYAKLNGGNAMTVPDSKSGCCKTHYVTTKTGYDTTVITSWADLSGGKAQPPASLSTMRLSDLLASPLYDVTCNYTVSISGSQKYGDSGRPRATIVYHADLPTLNVNDTATEVYYASYSKPVTGTAKYDIQNKAIGYQGLMTSFDLKVDSNKGTEPKDGTGMMVTIKGNVVVSLNCSGANLEDPVCRSFCNVPGQIGLCEANMLDYCFPYTSDPASMPIGSSQTCQTYVTNYTKNYVGPSYEFDDGLGRYCSRYANMGQLFSSGASATEQDLCACHLNAQLYDDYYAELVKQYPGLQNPPVPGTVKPCYLSQCAASHYPSTSTTKQCSVPQCVNIVSFDNEGNISSPITIQQNSDCQNLLGGACTKDTDCLSGEICDPKNHVCAANTPVSVPDSKQTSLVAAQRPPPAHHTCAIRTSQSLPARAAVNAGKPGLLRPQYV